MTPIYLKKRVHEKKQKTLDILVPIKVQLLGFNVEERIKMLEKSFQFVGFSLDQ